MRSKWGSFTRTVNEGSDPHEWEVELHTRLEKTRVEPADFDAFRKFHEEVGKYYRVWLTLKSETSPRDALALETLRALDPDDLSSAQTLARLYIDNDKTEEASRVLRQAATIIPRTRHCGN